MEAVASSPLQPAWKNVLGLAARGTPEFYEDSREVGNVPHAGALRSTLDGLEASAVFCVQQVPTVVILSLGEYDPVRITSLHAALWNQGLANLLVVVSGLKVRIFSLVRIPSSGDQDDLHTRCLVKALNMVADSLELRNLVHATESGRFWAEHRDYFKSNERVDRVLLDNLTKSHELLLEIGLSADQAQALLVQGMFVAYLADREIIGTEYFRSVSGGQVDDFRSLLGIGDIELLECLYQKLRDDFNGDLFVAPCSFQEDGAVPPLGTSHLKILERFLSGSEELHGAGGQFQLWPRYDFKYIPVELISAVQDRFLGNRGSGHRPPGAYYTPMFLADTVISQVWRHLPPSAKDDGRFLDPACGSGIFLVRLFQRLCEHRRAAQPGGTIPWAELLKILSRLKGCDLDGGAVRVAVFSLYLALLEEVRPPDLQTIISNGNALPPLYGKTLRRIDFFAVEPTDASADLVVGNPPWSSRGGEEHSPIQWCQVEGLPAPGNEQAWPFVWKSLRHLAENGVAAFLLPAMGFLHNHAQPAVNARTHLMREVRILSIVNFADLRFQLFNGPSRPAVLVLFGRHTGECSPYRFDYLTPKASLNLRARRLITIGSADRCRLDSRLVEADSSIFKKRLWMSEPEGRLFNFLARFRRLGDLVAQFGALSRRKESTRDRWVIGQGFKPTSVARLSDAEYRRTESRVVAEMPFLPIDKFRILRVWNEDLESWNDQVVHQVGFKRGFNGPRVLVPQGIGAVSGNKVKRLRAAYVDQPLTFRDTIQAVTVPPGDERRGKLLAGMLNSKLILWFAFHCTSSFGADRPKVHQAELLRLPFPVADDLPDPERARSAANALIDMVGQRDRLDGQTSGDRSSDLDLLNEVDALTYEFFCLSKEERILVDDTVDYVIPAAQPSRSRSPAVWRPATLNERREYARTLVDSLTEWLDHSGTIGTRLVARNLDLAILRLSLRDASGRFRYTEGNDEGVADALNRLADQVSEPFPGDFQSTPDFRVFVGRDLFLVKPVATRYWLRATALADANAIALDLHSVAGRRQGI